MNTISNEAHLKNLALWRPQIAKTHAGCQRGAIRSHREQTTADRVNQAGLELGHYQHDGFMAFCRADHMASEPKESVAAITKCS